MEMQKRIQSLLSRLSEIGVLFRAAPNDHVLVFRGPNLVAKGAGWVGPVFFWNTVVVIPTSDQLVPFNFVALSSDRQRVRMQGAATVRYQPEALRTRRNFSVNPQNGSYRTDDPRKFQSELGALLQEPIRGAVAKESLVDCLAGADKIKTASLEAIQAMEKTFSALGVEVSALTMGDVRVEDTTLLQALEAPFREGALQKADDAMAERRMAQSEHDRELALARVKAEKIEAEARRELIEQQGRNALTEAQNQALATAAALEGYAKTDPKHLLAIAYAKMAENPALRNVTLTPDLLDAVRTAAGNQG